MKKTTHVETSASPTRKEPSINKIMHTGGKNMSFSAWLRAAGQEHLRPEAELGLSAAGDWQGGYLHYCSIARWEPALLLGQWAQPTPCQCGSAEARPDLFLSRLGAGCRDQVTVPEECLALLVPVPCVHFHGAASRLAGGWAPCSAAWVCSSPLSSYSWDPPTPLHSCVSGGQNLRCCFDTGVRTWQLVYGEIESWVLREVTKVTCKELPNDHH